MLRDAVPTDVVVGPDGAYYVSTLTGFPFTASSATVYRVVPGQAPIRRMPGSDHALTDLAFAADGSLYVLQHASGILGVPFPFAGPGAVRGGAAWRWRNLDVGGRRTASSDGPRNRR